MLTRSIAVQRTARYHLLGDPQADWSELWFVLHGYGQLARRFLAEFTCVARPGRLIVAPEGLSRFYLRGTRGLVGASWMTSDEREREIEEQVAFLDAVRGELVAGRTTWNEGLLGFSQGAATAARWAVLGRRAPGRLILWGAGWPPDLYQQLARGALATTAVTLVAGEHDEHVSAESLQAERATLSELGAAPEILRFGGGHHLDSPLLGSLLGPTQPA